MSSYPIPYVTTRTDRGERTVDIYSRLLADQIGRASCRERVSSPV